MPAIWFEEKIPHPSADPYRMDVPLFVGLAPPRPLHRLPEPMERWVQERGWMERVRSESGPVVLRDVPVPVDSWETFRHFFFWPEARDDTSAGIYPLGRAVRFFFAQGGRKAYVVSMANPLSETAGALQRIKALERVLYGTEGPLDGIATLEDLASFAFPALSRPEANPGAWHAIHHGAALEDVAFVAYPDLPYLVSVPLNPLSVDVPLRSDEEIFVECSEAEPLSAHRRAVVSREPRCDEVGLQVWKKAVQAMLLWIQDNARDWILVQALPLPTPERDRSWWTTAVHDVWAAAPEEGGCGSAFLQCAFPWLVDASEPGVLLAPDGPLLGLLAANALDRGCFRSAAGRFPEGVSGTVPVLSLSEREKDPDEAHAMIRRLCLFHAGPKGVVLLSDRTTSLNPSYGPGSVSRLMGFIFKAARRLGDTVVFESSSPRTWNQLRRALGSLLEAIYAAGGLNGSLGAEAFHVTCGPQTMTQQDMDSGRLVARIQVQPAVPVEALQVVLSMEPDGTLRME